MSISGCKLCSAVLRPKSIADSCGYDRNVLSWYTDPAHHEGVAQLDREAQAAVRTGTEEKDFVTYVNSDRLDPIDYRYKGSERQAKLRKLKQAWDPNGIFTEEFLHA